MSMMSDADPGRGGRSAGIPPAPISARRAYAEVLIVFGLVFAANIIAAGEVLGGHGKPQTGGWGVFAPAIVEQVCNMALVSIVVILVSARRGVTSRWLGTRLPRAREGGPGSGEGWPGERARPDADRAAPGRAVRMAALGLLAFSAGGAVTVMATTRQLPHPVHPTVPYLVYALFGSAVTAVVEEMVALAFVVSTLKQAKRPVAEILVVAVLLRCSYHIYYGLGIIGVALWAAAFVLLYLRFRSVIPLIVIHFFWDSTQFLSLKWHWFTTVNVIAAVIFLAAALAIWLAERSGHDPRSPYAQPPYGTLPPYGPVAPYGFPPSPYGAPPPYPYPPPPGAMPQSPPQDPQPPQDPSV